MAVPPHLGPILAVFRKLILKGPSVRDASGSTRDVFGILRDKVGRKKEKAELQIRELELEQLPILIAIRHQELKKLQLENEIRELELKKLQAEGAFLSEQRPEKLKPLVYSFAKYDLLVVLKESAIVPLFKRIRTKRNHQQITQVDAAQAQEQREELRALYSILRKLLLIAVFLSQTVGLHRDLVRGPTLTPTSIAAETALVCLILWFVLGFYKAHKQCRLGGKEWACS